jgi:CelD/BcsL family acetyltransferase involved in cellulose biosynthesis
MLVLTSKEQKVGTLNEIDPLRDQRWIELTDRCERSSLFHTTEWLEALRRTYGYEPVVFTDARPSEPLRRALLFCRINSWLTGRRLVGVPFSDHCEPLLDSPEALAPLLNSLKTEIGPACRYIELRPLETTVEVDGFATSSLFYFHAIDLRPKLEDIFARLHKGQAQRAIRKAWRSGVTVEVGRSSQLLADFYALHKMSRHRKAVPLQPFRWFQNLAECLNDRLTIYVAKQEGHPAATILTARHKNTLVYKYGSLNPAYKRFGGTPHLFWKAIEEAKAQGLSVFDLGRSDVSNEGLLAFKEHLGATRSTLKYYRYPRPSASRWLPSVASKVYSVTPASIRTRLSARLYKHFG